MSIFCRFISWLASKCGNNGPDKTPQPQYIGGNVKNKNALFKQRLYDLHMHCFFLDILYHQRSRRYTLVANAVSVVVIVSSVLTPFLVFFHPESDLTPGSLVALCLSVIFEYVLQFKTRSFGLASLIKQIKSLRIDVESLAQQTVRGSVKPRHLERLDCIARRIEDVSAQDALLLIGGQCPCRRKRMMEEARKASEPFFKNFIREGGDNK